MHPISCQWPAFNYTAHGEMENVFVIDAMLNFYDGYLVFGNGILCHPDSVVNYTRCFAAKCNTNGDLVWWQRYDNEEIDVSEQWFNIAQGNRGGMIQNHEGQILSTFSTGVSGDEFNSESRDYLVELNISGEIIGQHLIDSSLAGYSFHGIIEDFSDSTYLAHGWFQDSSDVVNNFEPDAFMLKTDSLGNHIWQSTYTNTFSTYDVVKAVDGGFWLCAQTPSLGDCSDGFFQNSDLVLIKTDEFGNEEDRLQIGGECGKEVATVYEYEEDKVVLVGRLTNDENAPDAMYAGFYYSTLIEQQPNEILIETAVRKEYWPTNNGDFVDLHVIPNIGYLIVCNNQLTTAQGSGPDWRWMGGLLMLDANRDSLWFRKYSYYNNFPESNTQLPARHYLLDSKPTPDGGFICCGYIDQQASDPNPYLLTPWLFKVDSLGCLEPGCQDVGVSEIVIGLQNTMCVFPNPATDMANITFSLPAGFHEVNTELVVINIQGQEVSRQSLSPTAFIAPVQMDVSHLASGVYTVHWVSGTTWYDSVKLVKE